MVDQLYIVQQNMQVIVDDMYKTHRAETTSRQVNLQPVVEELVVSEIHYEYKHSTEVKSRRVGYSYMREATGRAVCIIALL